MFVSTATSHDETARAADVAVLPVGSFEQHGGHLPLATDTLIAATIAERVATNYDLLLLPPITIGCSHEHADFTGTVSISSVTLHAIVADIAISLERAGMTKLLLINRHGGNYVLSNVVQESNVGETSSNAPTLDDRRVGSTCETGQRSRSSRVVRTFYTSLSSLPRSGRLARDKVARLLDQEITRRCSTRVPCPRRRR